MVEHSHITKKPGSFYIPVSTVLSCDFHPHESKMAAAAPGIECISHTRKQKPSCQTLAFI